MLKTLLLDFTGVIAPDGFWTAMNKNVPNVDKYRPYFKEKSIAWDKGEIKMYETVKLFANKIGIPFGKLWLETVQGFRPYPEMTKFLTDVKKRYQTVMVSNYPKDLFEEVDKKYRLSPYFDDIIISADIHHVKPEKEFFDIVLSIVKVNKEEVLFIDDKEENVDTARRLGIKTIFFTNLAQLLADAKRFNIFL